MKDYLRSWAEELLQRKPIRLRSRITVTGERNQHLGPKLEVASVRVTVEPAATFEVVDAVPANEELSQFGYPDWVVFGLLDVFMVAESSPITNVRIILEKADPDPINSSKMAFRHAGRDAGRKIVERLKSEEGR